MADTVSEENIFCQSQLCELDCAASLDLSLFRYSSTLGFQSPDRGCKSQLKYVSVYLVTSSNQEKLKQQELNEKQI